MTCTIWTTVSLVSTKGQVHNKMCRYNTPSAYLHTVDHTILSVVVKQGTIACAEMFDL